MMTSEQEQSFVIGNSPQMLAINELIGRVAISPHTTVLIQGESGTGKELVARAIHLRSSRASRPFLGINCAAIPEQLLESELFGVEAGAFTDAKKQKRGLLEMAEGGTLLLDEVGEMKLGMQSKLLRVLETKRFKRVGATRDISIDLRLVSATNRNLREAIQRHIFREDLYYRLNVILIELPPLRERPEDILPLAHFFLAEISRGLNRKIRGFTAESENLLLAYHWPGNVRELRNRIEGAVVISAGEWITPAEFPSSLSQRPQALRTCSVEELKVDLPKGGLNLRMLTEQIERQLITQALSRTAGNQNRTAELLHLTRDELRYRLKRYGLHHTSGQ